jgi:hypothetical protein
LCMGFFLEAQPPEPHLIFFKKNFNTRRLHAL